jgi:hypothetical protein
MKVFLLYRDRDDPAKKEAHFHAQALTEDLELNTLFNAMAAGDEFLFEAAKQTLLSGLHEPDEIIYRQEILQDCLQHPAVIRQLYSLPLQAIENKRGLLMGIFNRYPSSVLSGGLAQLNMFVALLKSLRRIADQAAADFASPGFQRFFKMIQHELTDEYFAEVERHLKFLKFNNGVRVSAELGRGNEGSNYVLRRSIHDGESWIDRIFTRRSPSYSYTLPPRDDYGARALADIRERGLNLVANAVAQSAEHIDSFFNVLRWELGFYIGCLNLHEQLCQLGEPIAFPQPLPASERKHSFTGLYDASLALTMKQKVVGNDLQADGKDLFIITGANQGGKSTFLRSIGLAQAMMQCGMFVPAETFSANLSTRLFTHYKREEDTTMTSGKFDEELGRLSTIIENILPNSTILFNESFAATNEREGSEIARQILTALLEKQVQIFFVTHMYELASSVHQKQLPNAIFLRAERMEDGTRNFKLVEGMPLQTSFGIDLYNKIFQS